MHKLSTAKITMRLTTMRLTTPHNKAASIKLQLIVMLVSLLASLNTYATKGTQGTFEILRSAPFDASIFTQGFHLTDAHFYISSGGYKRSFIEKQTLEGKQVLRTSLPDHYFAEGLCYFNDALYLLTWRSGTAFKIDPETLKPTASMRYAGEGWGLTHNGQQLIMSNGSNTLQFKDADTFNTSRSLAVFDKQQAVQRLNELEYADASIWANAWMTNNIYQISAETGKVIQRWDLSAVTRSLKLDSTEAVLNGIAYAGEPNTFWITGKNWPKRFLIRFKSNNAQATP